MVRHLVHQRALSGADAVNALRPFYFAVHPDFFGQYPRERVSLLCIIMLRLEIDTLEKGQNNRYAAVMRSHVSSPVFATCSSTGGAIAL